tara:strand:+ start:61 stop:180 length:120 start_codon:yes stop_codon:yes gene_type:complete
MPGSSEAILGVSFGGGISRHKETAGSEHGGGIVGELLLV